MCHSRTTTALLQTKWKSVLHENFARLSGQSQRSKEPQQRATVLSPSCIVCKKNKWLTKRLTGARSLKTLVVQVRNYCFCDQLGKFANVLVKFRTYWPGWRPQKATNPAGKLQRPPTVIHCKTPFVWRPCSHRFSLYKYLNLHPSLDSLRCEAKFLRFLEVLKQSLYSTHVTLLSILSVTCIVSWPCTNVLFLLHVNKKLSLSCLFLMHRFNIVLYTCIAFSGLK